MKFKRPSIFIAAIIFCCGLNSSTSIAQHLSETTISYGRLSYLRGSAYAFDGSFVTSGYVYDSTYHGLLTKTDSSGAVRWSQTITIAGRSFELNSITSSADGSIIATGFASDDYYYPEPMLLCFNSDGKLLWNRHYNFGASARGDSHCLTSDGGIVMIGALAPNEVATTRHPVGYILKTDAHGMPLWCHRAAYSNATQSSYYRVIECKDSTLLLIGYQEQPATSSTKTTDAVALLHLSAGGMVLSDASYQSSGDNIIGETIVQSSDGSFVAGAAGLSAAGLMLPMMFHFSSVKELDWVSVGNFLSKEYPAQLYQLPNGELLGLTVTASNTDATPHVFTITQTGKIEELSEFSERTPYYGLLSQNPKDHTIFSVATVVNDGDIATHLDITTITGSLEGCGLQEMPAQDAIFNLSIASGALQYDLLSVKTDSLALLQSPIVTTGAIICFKDVNAVVADPLQSTTLHPNPAAKNVLIAIETPTLPSGTYEVVVHDLAGREVYRTQHKPVTFGEQILIPTTGMASGIYTVELRDTSDSSKVWQSKVVVE